MSLTRRGITKPCPLNPWFGQSCCWLGRLVAVWAASVGDLFQPPPGFRTSNEAIENMRGLFWPSPEAAYLVKAQIIAPKAAVIAAEIKSADAPIFTCSQKDTRGLP